MNKNALTRIVFLLNILAIGFYFGLTTYLGGFSRHLADDYCETVIYQSGNIINNLVNRYLHISDRYSNILFVGLTQLAGSSVVRVLPFIMIVLWLAGLFWLFLEINRTLGLGWSSEIILYLTLLLTFYTAFQAPNRYQVFYWRSGMATHFAPLVFLNYLVVFLLAQIRSGKNRTAIPLWVGLVLFFASFMIGGFSEPPVTIMIVGAGVAILYLKFRVKDDSHRLTLQLLTWLISGAMLALLVMAMAPANSLRVGDISPTFSFVVVRTMRYTYSFLTDSPQTLPIPTLLSIVEPALLFYIVYKGREYSSISSRNLSKPMLIAPLILVLLIAAGFSPSAYGQSYPVERARFFAYFLMTSLLTFEGALIGIKISRVHSRIFQAPIVLYGSLVLLTLLAFYHLRAGWQLLQLEPQFRTRAELWDARNAYIIKHSALGETDLVVPQFPGVYGIKEWDVRETHWVNRCAAEYYGVNSIRAVPIPDNFLREFFNE